MGQIISHMNRKLFWRVLFLLCMGLSVHTNPSQAESKASVDSLRVKGFSFSGNTVVSQSELEVLTQPYVGRSLTLSDLEEVVATMAERYKQKGFFSFANVGLIPSFNRDSVIPWYLHEPSDPPPLISVVSTDLSKTVVAEAETDVKSDDQSVARAIPPCFPESACRPVLTAPADGGDPELPTAK
jgi:hypothetical protein